LGFEDCCYETLDFAMRVEDGLDGFCAFFGEFAGFFSLNQLSTTLFSVNGSKIGK